MLATRFEHSTEMPFSPEQLWRFHVSPGALELLTPSLLAMRIDDPGNGVAEGSVVRARCGLWPLRTEWCAVHTGVEPGRGFTDVALVAPFPFWVHQHRFEALPCGGALLRDVIWFVPPRWLPKAFALGPVRWMLRALFSWRHRVTAKQLDRGATCRRCGPLALEAHHTGA